MAVTIILFTLMELVAFVVFAQHGGLTEFLLALAVPWVAYIGETWAEEDTTLD